MADLFTLTAPLLVRFPNDIRHVMVACFQLPAGILYFRPYWDELPPGDGICQLSGDIKGEGPWKVGDAVITVLGCQGSHPQQAAELAEWMFHLEQRGECMPTHEELRAVANEQGLLT